MVCVMPTEITIIARDRYVSDDHGDLWQSQEMEMFFKEKHKGICKGYKGCSRMKKVKEEI
jgi:hypothetical protein